MDIKRRQTIQLQTIPKNEIILRMTSEMRFEHLIDQAPVLMWVSDVAHGRVYFSKHWYEYTGLVAGSMPARGWINAVHPDDRHAVMRAFDMATEMKRGTKRIYRLRSRSGEHRWVLDRATPLHNDRGVFIGHIGSVVDIHNHKNAREKARATDLKYRESERRFQTLTRELEERVAERTVALEKVNADLMRANDDLEQYAYIASHDLQEPLRKIRFFTDLLSQRPGDTESLYIYLSKIEASASRMSTLIQDVLNYSTLLKNTPAFVDVNLNDIAREMLMSFAYDIENKKARVTVGPLPVVRGVPSQFLLLFNNLLGNSLTFAQSTPTIEITASEVSGKDKSTLGANPDRRYVQIDFKDNGIGFSEAYGDKIFDVFERLHNKGSHTGNGMGLPLCKKIVENHNGFIAVRSAEGVGSTFEIYLPLG